VGGTSPTTTQAIAEPLWIGPVNDPTFTLGADTAPNPLITLSNDSGVWIVKFDSRQIDAPPKPAPADPYEILCKVDSNLAAKLAFLHSPLEKGRASLSVFALPSGSIGDGAVLAGAGNQPLMMAGLEWRVAAGAVNLNFGGAMPQLKLTSASPTTLMNWTRTGKNFDILHTNDPSLLLKAANVGVQKTTNGYRFVRPDSLRRARRRGSVALAIDPIQTWPRFAGAFYLIPTFLRVVQLQGGHASFWGFGP
jgi:hypothetical protein